MTIVRLFAGCAMAVSAIALTGTPLPASAACAAKSETMPFQAQSDAPWFQRMDPSPPPLYDTLGTLSMPVTTGSAEAQRYFDQGLRLTYAFNHVEALRAYRMAQQLDPDCAMCFWGEALVLGPNINAPMDPAAVAPAVAAIGKAQDLAGDATEKERMLIDALAERYATDPDADRAALDAAYADAMAAVAGRFADDPDIATLYAASIMNTSPWDYWADEGRQPKGRTAEALAALEGALAEHPDHPGAIHYYIHLVEASDRPERAEPYADRLRGQMPGAGHLVHMPSHIYYRIGRYRDSLEVNRAAAAADAAYLAQVSTGGLYAETYYPHNVHFLLTSALMAGDGPTAIAAAERLQGMVSEDTARTVPWVQPIMQAPYLAHAQFSDPEVILALPDPGDAFPFVKAAWHYARGVAHATQGDTEAAAAEAEAITRLEETADFSGLTGGGVPAPTVLQIARQIVEGRIARAEGDLPAARDAFAAAAELQEGVSYMEPPYWYYPVHQSLGAVLLEMGELDAAEQAFTTALDSAPNNAWALYGLMQVHQARGDDAAVAELAGRFDQVWAGTGTPDLARL